MTIYKKAYKVRIVFYGERWEHPEEDGDYEMELTLNSFPGSKYDEKSKDMAKQILKNYQEDMKGTWGKIEFRRIADVEELRINVAGIDSMTFSGKCGLPMENFAGFAAGWSKNEKE